LGIVLAGAVVLLAGCFNIEMSMKLEEDLSGTLGMAMTIDMEPVVYVMASIQKGFSGEEGPPTAEELAEVRAEMEGELTMGEEFSDEEMRREWEEDLPEGFEVVSSAFGQSGLKNEFNFLIKFPHIDRLHELELNQPGEEAAAGAPGEVEFESISQPFGGLELIDEGDSWLLTTDAPNPMEDFDQQDEEMMFGMEQMLEDLFKSLRVALTIEVPGEIVEHNATRVEGRKLIWEFTPQTLKEGIGTDIDQIRVRFRK
jgi:hypothetical protein